jgi:hypothetical protein
MRRVSNPFTAAYGKTDIEAISPDAVPGDVEAAKIRPTKMIANTAQESAISLLKFLPACLDRLRNVSSATVMICRALSEMMINNSATPSMHKVRHGAHQAHLSN